jgi:hypothetical protein
MARREGILSDSYIRAKCYDSFLPISTGKLNAVQKPNSGSLLTSIKPPEETPQVNFVPYYVSENSVQDFNGQERINERKIAVEGLMNRVKNAKVNYEQLAGQDQRHAVLTQDVGIRNIREMQKIIPDKIKSVDVRLTDEDTNNPFNPLVQQSIAQRLINKHSTQTKEESALALSGAVRQIENIKNPDLSSEGLVTVMASRKDTSSLFVQKRQATQGRGQPGGEGAVLPADFNKDTLPGTIASGPKPGSMKYVPRTGAPGGFNKAVEIPADYVNYGAGRI